MARSTFGGTLDAWAFSEYRLSGKSLAAIGKYDINGKRVAFHLTLWSAKTGGTQYTDLLIDGAPTSTILVGTDGMIPEFEGPDGVTELWADAGGPRVKMLAPGVAVADDASVAAQVTSGPETKAALNAAYADRQATASALVSTVTPRLDQRISWLTTFEVGHGWNLGATGSSTVAVDTDDPFLGAQSIRAVVAADGLVNVEKANFSPVLDFTGKSLVVAVKIGPEVAHAAISVNAYTTSGAYFNWQPSADYWDNGWQFYEMQFDATRATYGTPDRASIYRIRVQFLNGVAGLHMAGGVGMRDAHPDYPNGVLTLTFDDAYLSQFTKARPKLDALGWAGTVYTIAGYIDTAGFCTTDQLRHLQNVCGWDVAAHAYSTATHTNRYTSLTNDEARADFLALQSWLQARGFRAWRHLATPGGQLDNRIGNVVRDHFITHRTSNTYLPSTIANQRPLPLNPLNLRDVAVNPSNIGDIAAGVQMVKDSGTWGLISFHEIDHPESITAAQFDALMDSIAAIGIPVRTLTEVMGV